MLELRGIPYLEEDVAPKQQIIASRSFGELVTDRQFLYEAVTMHASRAGEKLRGQGSAYHLLQVFIRTGQHNPKKPNYSNVISMAFPVATSDTRKLVKAAKEGVRPIYRPGYRYAKAGVMLCDIVPAASLQHYLFAKGDSQHSKELMQAMDHINQRFGRKTQYLAVENQHQEWTMKPNNNPRPIPPDGQIFLLPGNLSLPGRQCRLLRLAHQHGETVCPLSTILAKTPGAFSTSMAIKR